MASVVRYVNVIFKQFFIGESFFYSNQSKSGNWSVENTDYGTADCRLQTEGKMQTEGKR